MLAVRCMEPEWLDELPADDARAMRSRQDLRRINRLMFQAGMMARLLTKAAGERPPRTIVELGGGDGTFMLGVARKLKRRWPGVSLILVDRQDLVTDKTRQGFARLDWRVDVNKGDVFDVLNGVALERADIMTANLFLHHFSDESLRRLFAAASRVTDAFIACEPERSGLGVLGSRLLFAVGANDVTRHDALVSVRAGFRGTELSDAWPEPRDWDVSERAILPFTHGFAAWRKR